MHRAYLVLGALLVGLFSYGQYNHWSLYGTDAGNWRAHDPATLAAKVKDGELAIYLDCGTEDDFNLQDGASYLHEVLEKTGVKHEFTLLPGRHNYDFWKQRIDDSLAFHARQFAKSGF